MEESEGSKELEELWERGFGGVERVEESEKWEKSEEVEESKKLEDSNNLEKLLRW